MSRRDDLLAAARAVVEREGISNATVGAITREAGAALGLLNYHWGSRDEIVAEVFRQAAAADLAEVRAIGEDTGDTTAQLDAWLHSNDPGDRESWRLWVDAYGESLHTDAMLRILHEFRRGWMETLAGILRRGHGAGDWSCPDPDATAAAITAAIDGIGLHVAVHDVPADEARAWMRATVAAHVPGYSAVAS